MRTKNDQSQYLQNDFFLDAVECLMFSISYHIVLQYLQSVKNQRNISTNIITETYRYSNLLLIAVITSHRSESNHYNINRERTPF